MVIEEIEAIEFHDAPLSALIMDFENSIIIVEVELFNDSLSVYDLLRVKFANVSNGVFALDHWTGPAEVKSFEIVGNSVDDYIAKWFLLGDDGAPLELQFRFTHVTIERLNGND